jgi:hypothetical protein
MAIKPTDIVVVSAGENKVPVTQAELFQETNDKLTALGLTKSLTFKERVANAAALPLLNNTKGDARITDDTGHLYAWDGSSWLDQGDIIDLTWSAITGKPTSLVVDIDDAVAKKHAHANKVELDKLTDGDHDVRNDNPHVVTKIQIGLEKVTNDAQVKRIEVGVPNGVATLDASGLIPSEQLPPIAITDIYVVNSEVAMLALIAEKGDIAIRSDVTKTYVLQSNPATVLANWKELLTATSAPVLSVNGKISIVSLNQDDILDGIVYKQYSQAEKSKLGLIESNAVSLTTVKADADIAGAVAKKHTQNSDTALRIDKLVVLEDGNVGIGTVTPSAELEVNGKIKATNLEISGTIVAPIAINTQTDNYTLVLVDNGKLIDINKSTPVTLTVPKYAYELFPIGTVIVVRQGGIGKVTIAPVDSEVILNNPDGLKITKQYAMASLIKMDLNVWSVVGSLEA